jgi:hypothetical protein
VRSNHFALIYDFVGTHRPFLDVQIKVIAPKIHHHFVQLPLRFHGTHQLGRHEFSDYLRRNALVHALTTRLLQHSLLLRSHFTVVGRQHRSGTRHRLWRGAHGVIAGAALHLTLAPLLCHLLAKQIVGGIS